MAQAARLVTEGLRAFGSKALPKPLYAYVSGAVEDNLSLGQNRRSFEEIALRPRVLVGVSSRDLSFSLFGHRYTAPFGLAPMGISALFAYRGECRHGTGELPGVRTCNHERLIADSA